MNKLEALAIEKAIPEKALKEFRKQANPGVYTVGFLARISGTLTIGNDYEQRIVAKANPWKLLAIALSKLNGVTVDSIVREAEVSALDCEAIKDQAEEAMATFKAATVTSCKGKVTASLSVSVIGSDDKVAV